MRALPALLAIAASVTAACLSVQSGLQRGGSTAERALWVAIGVVLVIAAHLLPALCRPHGVSVRMVGAVIWFGCIAATCYGHAVFFLMAQKHVGELRAAAVPVVADHGRDLAAIATDRAAVVTRLARVTARQCVEPCPSLRAERTGLAAKLSAIDVEIDQAKRIEQKQDRADAARDAALADPVTGALAAFGVATTHADLITGLAFAGVLESVACFSWLLALVPTAVPQIAVTPAQQASNAAVVTPVAAMNSGAEQDDDVTRVTAAVAANELRATVNEIRRFLGCSQSRAMAIRKQIAEAPT
jgi:hypothetical protein